MCISRRKATSSRTSTRSGASQPIASRWKTSPTATRRRCRYNSEQTVVKTHPQAESKQANGESGFMLVFAVTMVAIVLIGTAVAVPVVAKQLRRDKEVESMHRMQQ